MHRSRSLLHRPRRALATAGVLLVVGCLGLPAASSLADDVTQLTSSAFDDSRSDDWTLTSGQVRLLTALSVVAGMVTLAVLAAWCVTWLADRGPTGGPAPLIGRGDFGDGDGRS